MICKTNAVIGGSVGGGSDNGESVKPTQPLEINVPDSVATGGYVYTFNIDNEWVLVSGSASGGLWLCNTVTNTYEQLIKASYNYKYFYKVKDKVVISSSNNATGLYIYNHLTKTCEKKFSAGYDYKSSVLVNDTLLLSSGSITLRFDYETELFEEFFNENGNSMSVYYGFYQYGDKVLCNAASSGIYVYNDLDKSFVKILSPKSYVPNIRHTEHGTLINYYDGTTYYFALLDKNFDTILSQHIVGGTSAGSSIEHENGILFVRLSGSDKGFYWFDYANKTLEKVYADGYNVQANYTKIFGKYIFFVCGTGLAGCVLFDTETKEVVRPVTTGMYFAATLVNDKLVLTHYNSNYKGLYVYDISTKELVTLNTTSYMTSTNIYGTASYQLKDRIIAVFTQYIYSINLADNTYKSLSVSNVNADNVEFLATENNLFINTKGANARCYNYETDSFILPTSSNSEIYGEIYHVYKLDGENCYAYHEDKTKNPYTLYFDSEKKQWLIDKYYLGEI